MYMDQDSASAADGWCLRSSSSSDGFGGGEVAVGTVVGPKCCRWNPTPEQVKVLTDLFRSGLRTPTTDQIQSISSHLSSFGKIESKNVFYWFQNHKARERHHQYSTKKRRRRQECPPSPTTTPTPPFLIKNINITTALPPPPTPLPIADQNLIACHRNNSSLVIRDATTFISRSVACGVDLAVAAAGELEERDMETLELFPLTSQPTTRMIMATTSRKNHNHHKEVAAPLFSTSFSANDLLLDLRLSSL